MRQNENQICILDTDDGTVKILLDFGGNWYGYPWPKEYRSRLSIQLDEAGGNLYIGEYKGTIEGLCIDLSTWKVRSRIPGLVGFASRSRQIIKHENKIQGWEHHVSYPEYSLEEPIEKGNNLLRR